jgi:hypothetical protein
VFGRFLAQARSAYRLTPKALEVLNLAGFGLGHKA